MRIVVVKVTELLSQRAALYLINIMQRINWILYLIHTHVVFFMQLLVKVEMRKWKGLFSVIRPKEVARRGYLPCSVHLKEEASWISQELLVKKEDRKGSKRYLKEK